MIKKALIIIDFINDIVDLEGKFTATAKFCHTHHVIEKANQAISFARKESFTLAFVKVGFSKNYSECSPYSPIFQAAKQHNALQLNQWGTFFHKDLDYKTEDFTIVKHRISAFYGTSLDLFLRAHQVKHLYLAGVSTDLAIQTTAREAHDRDYHVTIVQDACGAESIEEHLTTLNQLKKIADILPCDKLR